MKINAETKSVLMPSEHLAVVIPSPGLNGPAALSQEEIQSETAAAAPNCTDNHHLPRKTLNY